MPREKLCVLSDEERTFVGVYSGGLDGDSLQLFWHFHAQIRISSGPLNLSDLDLGNARPLHACMLAATSPIPSLHISRRLAPQHGRSGSYAAPAAFSGCISMAVRGSVGTSAANEFGWPASFKGKDLINWTGTSVSEDRRFTAKYRMFIEESIPSTKSPSGNAIILTIRNHITQPAE